MDFPTPRELKAKYPLSDLGRSFVEKSRKALAHILEGIDQRLLLIVGPCSIHNVEEGLLFAKTLQALAEQVRQWCFIIMRAYIEKPRTLNGWKGLVYDPYLNGSCHIIEGLATARAFLVRLAEMEVPAATEFLTPHIAPYIADTISWGCIGARTSSSQIHRTLASALEMPVGFKNSVDGNVDCAISGVYVASRSHTFIHFDDNGKLCPLISAGNPHAHVVLRGSVSGPNYDKGSVLKTLEKLGKKELPERILIDCSHGNSGGRYDQQREVFKSVALQVARDNRRICGLMLESNLQEGKQSIPAQRAGVSITDSCLDFSTTAELIVSLSSEGLRSTSFTHN